MIENEKVIEQIKKDNGITVRVKRSGMFQRITLKLSYDDTPGGKVMLLKTDRLIDLGGVERLVSEIGLPIKLPNGIFIPKGKKLSDFISK